MEKIISVGISNFKELIENNYYLVDKSLLIKEFLNDGAKIILIPRPRRFGKTLNLSMLKYFFDVNTKEESIKLFEGLNIQKEVEFKYQGKFPVVLISFKDVEYDNYEDFISAFRMLMSATYDEYSYLLEGNILLDEEKNDFKTILARKGDVVLLATAIKRLVKYLYKYHNREVILLIDEYDVPIQAGYMNNYYDKMILFIRNVLSSVLKDNEYIKKAMLTGILRIGKESIFSGMNNLEVYTLLNQNFSDNFGFTQIEIDRLVLDFKEVEQKEQIKKWYDGYKFGGITIYNPWSVLSYLKNKNEGLKPYWINSSGNILVKALLSQGDEEVKSELQDLIEGKTIKKTIDDNIVMTEIENSPENVWSFLLMTGYLKYNKKDLINGKYVCDLSIPNKEVSIYYTDMILKWFEDSITMRKYKVMLNSLVTGDIELFEGFFKDFVINNISYFDVSGKEPERVYHAFVLGMLISLQGHYDVKSNKESGYGRYDVMIIPKDKSKIGIIMEFKKIDDFMTQTIEEAAIKALKQIEDMKYETELIERDINKILKLAIIFKGKEICIIK
jgi:hypothetical protein